MTTPIPNVDNTTLNNLTPNLDIGDVADPALRLAAFQYIYTEMQTIITAYNAFVANGAIATANLADLSVTTAKIALLAVTAAQIANGTITTTQLAAGAVTSTNILDGTILDVDINDTAAIAWSKLNKAGSSLGDLTTRSAADLTSGTLNVARIPTAIPATSIGNGDVDNTELSYLNNVTGPIQTQINNKLSAGGASSIQIVGNVVQGVWLASLIAVDHGGTGVTSITGVLIGNGTSAFTATPAPTGLIVGTTDTQTLTNKTLTAPNTTNLIDSVTLSAMTVGGSYCGDTAVINLDASCNLYDVLYASSTGYKQAKADADSTIPCVALCLASGAGARLVLKRGYLKNNAWSWTAGQLLYLSPTTAGLITSTLPTTTGNRVQIVGYAESATIIYFNPDYTFVQV